MTDLTRPNDLLLTKIEGTEGDTTEVLIPAPTVVTVEDRGELVLREL